MTFDLNDYLQMYRDKSEYFPRAPRITCKDGFSISVQANAGAYCSPRINTGPYTHVECGFPSAVPQFIMEYCESPEDPTETVYGYVPVELVSKLIIAHGGFSVQLYPAEAFK